MYCNSYVKAFVTCIFILFRL